MQITGKVRKVTTLAPQSAAYHLRDTTSYLGLIKYFVSTAYGAKLLVSLSYPLFSTAFWAYSTWNTRPSGENWDAERSY